MPGPVCSEACSVASPISQASGMSAAADRTNERRRAEVEPVAGGERRPERGRAMPRGSSAPRRYPSRAVIEAVLFDWGNTLVQFTWDDELLAAGPSGRPRTRRFRRSPSATGTLMLGDERRGARMPTCSRELGVADPEAFIEAEHEVWRPAHAVLGSAQALLGSLRARGLKTGLVANSWPEPARLLRADAEAFGLAPLLDVMVFSEEVGVAKPEPEIFLHALEQLGVEPAGRDVRRRPPRGRCARSGECGHDDRPGIVVCGRRQHRFRSSRTSWRSRRWTC